MGAGNIAHDSLSLEVGLFAGALLDSDGFDGDEIDAIVYRNSHFYFPEQ